MQQAAEGFAGLAGTRDGTIARAEPCAAYR